MRRTDSLFQLIKSLDRAEKRNYKLLTQLTSGDKKYLKLFDAIDRQSEYDEKKIIRQFKGENFIRQFSVAKNYLYNSILGSLSYYYKGPDGDLSEMGIQVKVLMGKHLVSHARKLLRKAISRAENEEHFHELLKLLQFKRELWQISQKYKNFQEFDKDIREKELTTMHKLQNLMAFRHLQDYANHIIYYNRGPDYEKARQDLQAILQNPLMQTIDAAGSLHAQLIFLCVRRDIARFLNDTPSAKAFAEKTVSFFEKHPEFRRNSPVEYVQAIFALQENPGFTEDRAGEIAQLVPKSAQEQVAYFQRNAICQLVLSSKSGDLPAGKVAVAYAETGLANFKGKLRKSDEFLIIYYCAWMCFVAGEFSPALRWVNRFLNIPKTEVREDLQCMIRILNVLVHYELGNYDVVEHSLKSTQRFIARKMTVAGGFPEWEGLILKYVRKLSELASIDSGLKPILIEFRTELAKLPSQNDLKKQFAPVLNIAAWIEAKIHHTLLANVLASKDTGK